MSPSLSTDILVSIGVGARKVISTASVGPNKAAYFAASLPPT